MRKLIKKWGEGLGIYLDKEDCKVYNLKEGEVYDVKLSLVSNYGN